MEKVEESCFFSSSLLLFFHCWVECMGGFDLLTITRGGFFPPTFPSKPTASVLGSASGVYWVTSQTCQTLPNVTHVGAHQHCWVYVAGLQKMEKDPNALTCESPLAKRADLQMHYKSFSLVLFFFYHKIETNRILDSMAWPL